MSQVNILVDKDGSPKIAGLGSASFLPHSAGWEGGTSGDRLFRGRAPEITWLEVPPGMNDSTYPTKASDMYAFGVMVWEVRIASFVRRYSVHSIDAGPHGPTTIL